MKLLLTQDVDGLGARGEVVDVSDGYGRNYLLPKGKAIKATTGAVRTLESARARREEKDRKERLEAEQVAAGLVKTRVVIAAHAGDEGRLFGSVGAADVVAGIKKFTGVDIDRKHVDIPTPIRAIGLHEVRISLHPEVEFPVTIDVIPA
jgi:large subunit ribosomal protein L9